MSRKLNLGLITSTAFMPTKSGTWQFIQDSYNEQVIAAAGASNPIFSLSNPYIVFGVQFTVPSGGAGSFSYTAGWVYYSGELFQVLAGSGTQVSGHVIVSNIDVNNYLTFADPVTFSDGSTNNYIHNIRTISFIDSASAGAGQSVYTDFLPLNPHSVSAFTVSSFVSTFTFSMHQDATIELPNSMSGSKTLITGDALDVPGTKVKLIIGCSGSTTIGFSISGLRFVLIKNTGVFAGTFTLPARTPQYVIEIEYLGIITGGRVYTVSYF